MLLGICKTDIQSISLLLHLLLLIVFSLLITYLTPAKQIYYTGSFRNPVISLLSWQFFIMENTKSIYILTEFLVWLESRNYATHTIEIYEDYLVRWNNFITSTYNITINEPRDFKINMIDEYIKIIQLKYSPKTVNLMIASIRSYMKYCDRVGHVDYDYRRLTYIREDDKEAVFLSKEDYEKILARISAHEEDKATRIRNLIVCKVLFQGMLRVWELTALKETDFYSIGGSIFIQVLGKGKIIRSVAINPKVYSQILEYIQYRKSNDWYLFVSHSNNSYGNRISKNGIEDIIKKYRVLCGINKKITPHSLRHGGATLMVIGGTPLPFLKDTLWHKHITTTQKYLHTTNPDKAKYQSLLRE